MVTADSILAALFAEAEILTGKIPVAGELAPRLKVMLGTTLVYAATLIFARTIFVFFALLIITKTNSLLDPSLVLMPLALSLAFPAILVLHANWVAGMRVLPVVAHVGEAGGPVGQPDTVRVVYTGLEHGCFGAHK